MNVARFMKKYETDEFARIPEGAIVISSRSYQEWHDFAKDMEKQRNRYAARLTNALSQRDEWALKYAKLKGASPSVSSKAA